MSNQSRLHELPTNRQLEIFYMLHQVRSQQYECSTQNLGNVVLSNVAKNPQLTLSADQLSVEGAQGYRSVFATHGISVGTYYYECQYSLPMKYVPDPNQPEYRPQVRVGFAAPAAHLDGPVGFDRFGYALRSADCSICTQRLRLPQDKAQSDSKFDVNQSQQLQINPGQTIGCLIHMPVFKSKTTLPVEVEMCESKSHQKITARRQNEDTFLPEQMTKKFEVEDEVVQGSFIKFYVDGAEVIEIKDILYNRYYPAVSCYNFATVKCNFGLKNVKIQNYPMDFYVLADCLYNPLEEAAKTLKFGYAPLNLDLIFKTDEEDKLELQKENPGQTPLQIKSETTDINPQSVTNATETVPDSVTNDDETLITIKQEDLNRTGTNRVQFRQFLRNLSHNLNSETEIDNSCPNPYTESDLKSKGFQFPPPHDFLPFTSLYKIRSRNDYEKTAAMINDGLYSVFMHREIAKLVHENEQKPKKGRK
ncbi:Conserved_hypothetical protein [Hexamita inflata]|uniref:Uncharacterized protein n=1 Tax=Hexamita inflata TaxID=28002 RepID=A0AA86QSH9_9EUKA|nr:Conserved hypothetical protein [Hexamita inflata]